MKQNNISLGFPIAEFPHCDELVLHAPKTCEVCDLYPQKQKARIDNNINFTGEGDPNKQPCPAESKRPLDTINRWPGNLINGWLSSGLSGGTNGKR